MFLYFITGNKGKFSEVKAFITSVKQLEIDLAEIQDIDPQKIIEHKLNEAFKHHKGQFIVEDTSLYLDCLNGLPGPLIKWFMQTIGNEGLSEIAKRMNNNKALAKTIIGYAKNKNSVQFFEGSINGSIVSPRGTNGFGWDPIFQPKYSTKTFAQMSQEEKSSFKMHRRIAIEKLQKFLKR